MDNIPELETDEESRHHRLRLMHLDSISRAVEECGGNPSITIKEKEIETGNPSDSSGSAPLITPWKTCGKEGCQNCLPSRWKASRFLSWASAWECSFWPAKATKVGKPPALGWIDGEVRRLEPTPERKGFACRLGRSILPEGLPLFVGISRVKTSTSSIAITSAAAMRRISSPTPHCGNLSPGVARV